MVSAIILAGGESRRMGMVKQLLSWGESTMLQQVIANARESSLDEIIVVLGYKAQDIVRKIACDSIRIAVNLHYGRGMSSSLKCGLAHVSESSEAFMIMLGDQPLIESDLINLLLTEHFMAKRGITIPVYKGIRGHPVIFDKKYRGELSGLTGDQGGKQIIEIHSDDILDVEVSSEGILVDIDTISDYRNVRGNS